MPLGFAGRASHLKSRGAHPAGLASSIFFPVRNHRRLDKGLPVVSARKKLTAGLSSVSCETHDRGQKDHDKGPAGENYIIIIGDNT